MAQRITSLPAVWENQVRSLGWEDPLEKKWQLTPVFLPGESHGQRSLVGYNPWVANNRTRLSTYMFLQSSFLRKKKVLFNCKVVSQMFEQDD